MHICLATISENISEGSLSSELPVICDKTTQQLLLAALKNLKKIRQRRKQEATASLDAAKKISVDASVAEVQSELDGIFTLTEW